MNDILKDIREFGFVLQVTQKEMQESNLPAEFFFNTQKREIAESLGHTLLDSLGYVEKKDNGVIARKYQGYVLNEEQMKFLMAAARELYAIKMSEEIGKSIEGANTSDVLGSNDMTITSGIINTKELGD